MAIELFNREMAQRVVHLVGTREDQRRIGYPPTHCIQNGQRTLRVDGKVLQRIDETGDDRNLRREMEHRLGVAHRIVDC